MMASFMSTVMAPAQPMSSAVIGAPSFELPITMRPNRSRMSASEVVSAKTAMISDATVMSNEVSRVIKFSVLVLPIVMPRRNRSLVSTTRLNVMVDGSMFNRTKPTRARAQTHRRRRDRTHAYVRETAEAGLWKMLRRRRCRRTRDLLRSELLGGGLLNAELLEASSKRLGELALALLQWTESFGMMMQRVAAFQHINTMNININTNINTNINIINNINTNINTNININIINNNTINIINNININIKIINNNTINIINNINTNINTINNNTINTINFINNARAAAAAYRLKSVMSSGVLASWKMRASIAATSRLLAAVMAWISPVRWRLNSSCTRINIAIDRPTIIIIINNESISI